MLIFWLGGNFPPCPPASDGHAKDLHVRPAATWSYATNFPAEAIQDPGVGFPDWSVHSCQAIASPGEIAISPTVPVTHLLSLYTWLLS